jgi:hypothetical protein
MEVWDNIETMPYYFWGKVMETGDLRFIYKESADLKKEFKVDESINEVWLSLQQQHIDEFGVEDTLAERNRTIKKLIDLNIEFIRTRDRFLLNLIEIEEINLGNISTNHFKMYEVLDSMTSFKKFDIDPMTYSVKKWYYTLKNMATYGNRNQRE